MKRKIFRPGLFSLFMIALMMYLSCNKQNNTVEVPRQKISASRVKDPHRDLKWIKKPVIKANNKLKPFVYK